MNPMLHWLLQQHSIYFWVLVIWRTRPWPIVRWGRRLLREQKSRFTPRISRKVSRTIFFHIFPSWNSLPFPSRSTQIIGPRAFLQPSFFSMFSCDADANPSERWFGTIWTIPWPRIGMDFSPGEEDLPILNKPLMRPRRPYFWRGVR